MLTAARKTLVMWPNACCPTLTRQRLFREMPEEGSLKIRLWVMVREPVAALEENRHAPPTPRNQIDAPGLAG